MKILLAGDSTVTTQPRTVPHNPAVCYCGWGQQLPLFVQPNTEVHNFAISGFTTETFRTEGQYEKLCAMLSAGDFVLFQFGHNDQKCTHLRADGGFAQRLQQYAAEVKARGATPVFVSPVARNTWRGDTGQYCDLLAPYAETMRQAAQDSRVPYLDLHTETVQWMQVLGLQAAKKFFHPGDYTHPNDFGGYHWARLLSRLILSSQDVCLAALQAAFLPEHDWQSTLSVPPACDAVFGWTAAPARRSDFAQWDKEGLLTAADALCMAQVAYGFFVCEDTEAVYPFAALSCAKENGYLPDGYPCEAKELARPIAQALFVQLMQLACRSRNAMPDSALALRPEPQDGTVTNRAAIAYAKVLERLATGSSAAQQTYDRPKGS